MADYLLAVVQPDFMQAMVLCAGVFLLTLEHRPHWKLRYAAALAAGFALGGLLGVAYDWAGTGRVPGGAWAGAAISAVYFTLPLAAGYLTLRLCARISRADAVYGTACVYAVQHIQFCLSIILSSLLHRNWNTLLNWPLLAIVMMLGYLLACWMQCGGRYGVTRRKAAIVLGIMVVIGLLLNFPYRFLPELRDTFAYPLGLAYDMFSCLFLLLLLAEQQREIGLAASAETERRLRIQMQGQYRLSQETIDIINRKCHDLKHQVSALRLVTSPAQREKSLQELEHSAMIYDANVQTGNRVLDTVLTEKSLLCERRHISCTCMAQGALLDFVSPVDLYTLFGNALDNAIEASEQLPDAEKRHVSVTVQRRLGGAFIQVENYFDHPLAERDGRIVTTKTDAGSHGFGLESIRQIARRYGGTADVAVQDHIFTLSVFLPLPQ